MTSEARRRGLGSRTGRLLAGVVALGLAFSGCARGDTDDPGTEDGRESVFVNGAINEQPEAPEPTEGGQLNFAAYSEARSLDPVVTINTGSTGGIQMATVFDVLLRYNTEAEAYEPWLAESFETSDNLTWVLTLRDGVTFSDGTPLDADAVVWSINRYVEGGGGQSMVWNASVASTTVTGPLEVTFELQRPWDGFGYMLATAPGMIVAESSDAGDEFTPVGAGPFVLDRFSPGEEMVMTRRDDYWKGTPKLESVRFFAMTNEPGRFEAFEGGQADVAYVREPKVVTDAVAAGYPGYMEVSALSRLLLMNHEADSNTSDVRIRKAVAHAVDPEFIDERENDGMGIPTTALFPEMSKWHLDTEPLAYDPEKAKALVEEAKADGHSGVVRFIGVQGAGDAFPLAIKAQLEAVGLTVELENTTSVTDLVQSIYVESDYDTTIWGFGVPDGEGGVLSEMYESFHSQGGGPNHYADDEMDALVLELQEAVGFDEQKAVLERIQQRFNETVPSVSVGAMPDTVVWHDNVHGIASSIDVVVLLGDAYIAE